MAERENGIVKFYDSARKYGFITSSSDDIFFSLYDVKDRVTLTQGQEVTFVREEVPESDRKKPEDRWKAVSVEVMGSTSTSSSEPSEPSIAPSSTGTKPGRNNGLVVYSLDDASQNDEIILLGSDYSFSLSYEGKNGPEPREILFKASVPVELYNIVTQQVIKSNVQMTNLSLPKDGLHLMIKTGRKILSTVSWSAIGQQPIVKTLRFGVR